MLKLQPETTVPRLILSAIASSVRHRICRRPATRFWTSFLESSRKQKQRRTRTRFSTTSARRISFNDPATYQILGIIDWETICILPCWDIFLYPNCFQDIKCRKEEEPLVPGHYNDGNDHNIVLRDGRKAQTPRDVFDETLSTAANKEGSQGTPAATVNSRELDSSDYQEDLDEIVKNLVKNWKAARYHLERLKEDIEEDDDEEEKEEGKSTSEAII